MIILNSALPQCIETMKAFNYANLRIDNHKNLSFHQSLEVYAETPILPIIKYMGNKINPRFKIVLVDVKLHDLQLGDVPCIPGWHIDGGPTTESEYFLCVAGSSLTQFNTESIELLPETTTQQLCRNLNTYLADRVSWAAPEWGVVHYNNLNPHRGAPAHITGKRLLIRVMGSNKIMPQMSKDWRPTQYASLK